MKVEKKVGKLKIIAYEGSTQQQPQKRQVFVNISFKDINGNTVNYVKINSQTGEAQVFVDIKVTDGQGNVLPVSGSYIVPYRSALDGRQKGSVLINVQNGQGQKKLTFSRFQTGVYVVVGQDILDAQTMQPLTGVEIKPEQLHLAVVE